MELYETTSSINEILLAYIIEGNGGQAIIIIYCIVHKKEDIEAHVQLLLFS